MKRTVGDLLGYSTTALNVGLAQRADSPMERMKDASAPGPEMIFIVRILMDPQDVEILDGKLVYEKRVVARGYDEAVRKFGVEARTS